VLRTRHWKTPYRNGRRTCESADADAATDAFVDEAAIFSSGPELQEIDIERKWMCCGSNDALHAN
jgi:hypothetical protein